MLFKTKNKVQKLIVSINSKIKNAAFFLEHTPQLFLQL